MPVRQPVEVRSGRRLRVVHRCCTPGESRLPNSESSRLDVPRAGSTCASTPSGSSAISRANRCRRAISNDTRATSHGRRGTLSGRSIRPTCSTKTRVAPSTHGTAHRDGVHDAAVEVVLVAHPRRRQRPRYGGARHHTASTGPSRTSARRPARCWPRTPGTGSGALERDVPQPRPAASSAGPRSRCASPWRRPGGPCAAGGRRTPRGRRRWRSATAR